MYRQAGTTPNFTDIARRYGMNRHTVAKYWKAGGQVEDARRCRPSGLDRHRAVSYTHLKRSLHIAESRPPPSPKSAPESERSASRASEASCPGTKRSKAPVTAASVPASAPYVPRLHSPLHRAKDDPAAVSPKATR